MLSLANSLSGSTTESIASIALDFRGEEKTREYSLDWKREKGNKPGLLPLLELEMLKTEMLKTEMLKAQVSMARVGLYYFIIIFYPID
jgi:hypothetical protein